MSVKQNTIGTQMGTPAVTSISERDFASTNCRPTVVRVALQKTCAPKPIEQPQPLLYVHSSATPKPKTIHKVQHSTTIQNSRKSDGLDLYDLHLSTVGLSTPGCSFAAVPLWSDSFGASQSRSSHHKPAVVRSNSHNPDLSSGCDISSKKDSISLPNYPEAVQGSKSDTEIDGTEKVKTKILTMWNNMKYSWSSKIRTNFSKTEPVCLLGQLYEQRMFERDLRLPPLQDLDSQMAWIEAFKLDFYSRLWFTYRKEFPAIESSTSDCGWGCMLRSGQMMLAQALVCHFLGRAWRFIEQSLSRSDREKDSKHRKIVNWFLDTPGSPFSIHSFVSLGVSGGKKVGDWYGPGAVAHLIRQAVENGCKDHPELEDIVVYVAQDCAVYKEDLLDQCLRTVPPTTCDQNPTQHRYEQNSDVPLPTYAKEDHFSDRKVIRDVHQWRSVLILVPTRLGTDKLNPTYVNCIKALLSLEQCVGIIGGRPRHSLYFLGFQEDKLIHLDPHYCQESILPSQRISLDSFHCSSPRKMNMNRMDPSCCLGFYCRTKVEINELVKASEEYQGLYPVFVFHEGRNNEALSHSILTHPLDESFCNVSANSDDESETEEFVLLNIDQAEER